MYFRNGSNVRKCFRRFEFELLVAIASAGRLESLLAEILREQEVGMNKGQLVDNVASQAEVTKKQADAVISATLESIMDAVAAGDKVQFVQDIPKSLFLARNEKIKN